MEVLLSAVAGELVSRLVSFLLRKYQDPGATNDMFRLQQALLRARMVVEEAEGRQITNQAMLQQLNQLRLEMCRCAYVLDAFTRRAVGSNRTSLAMVVERLEAELRNMKEFVVLLGSCPRVPQQPYSTYLFMERCIFGRQMEKEKLIGFLLQPAQDLDVLPIIGPHEIGKQTLVEHVCLEDRVREHFSKIHRLNSCDLDLPIHRSLVDATARSLIVIDFTGDADEESWRRFHMSMRRRGNGESKVVIISRTERHASLGTVPPLRLRAPRREELWYFFKALAFGGAVPEERPELVRVAMALFDSIPDCTPFVAASKIAASLRADLSARSWRRLLRVGAGETMLQLDRPEEEEEEQSLFMPVKDAPNTPCLLYNRRKATGVAQSELPKMTMLELLGSAVPAGVQRVDVLDWQSRIPPYASYLATCDMERARQMVVESAAKKRIPNKRRRGQQHDDRGKT
ncbi:hypothetical protein EJB05_23933, partial [Eragrostis curvula]